MPKEHSRLSRRSFVEHSALAAGAAGRGRPGAEQELRSRRRRGCRLSLPPRGVNARQHGAKGDGKTDDTKALQAALDAAQTARPDLLRAGRALPAGWAGDGPGRGDFVRRLGRRAP